MLQSEGPGTAAETSLRAGAAVCMCYHIPSSQHLFWKLEEKIKSHRVVRKRSPKAAQLVRRVGSSGSQPS